MRDKKEIKGEEKFYLASQWQLMWRKFVRHKLAIGGGVIVLIFYILAIFCEFFSSYDIYKRYPSYANCSPQRVHFFDKEGEFSFRPFVYGIKGYFDMETARRVYSLDKTKKYFIYFFVHGDEYKLWNLFPMDIHLFGVKEGTIFLFGTGRLGRDLFSRTLYAARISLSVGLVGLMLSFILGASLGGVSGFYGGSIDMLIQRVIDFLICIPTLPLWMSLAAALPAEWPPLKVYFGITIILSLLGWPGLARVVRGKLLELREEDFTTAAKISGTSEIRIITTHLLPSFSSYFIVSLTISVPYMILGETTLSFLGIGLRPPVVSWGVLLQQAQNVHTLAFHPWLLIPSFFLVIVILAFNALGDGLRDAADPYK